MDKNYRLQRQISTFLLYAAIAVVLVIIAFPIYWLLITSVKTGAEVSTYPPVYIPSKITWENYTAVLKMEGVPKFFFNSVIIAFVSTVFTTIIGALAAYALSKNYLSFAVRQVLMLWILVTRIFPPITTAIPYYVIIKNLGLSDTHLAIILTYTSYGLPFVIWLMLGFFQDLPKDIEKAAIVDGCSMWQRFRDVVLPLTLPGLAVTAIFAFIYSWNEFLYASIMTSFTAKTLPVLISTFISDQYLKWGEMSALGSMMILPVMIFSAATQKYLVRGFDFWRSKRVNQIMAEIVFEHVTKRFGGVVALNDFNLTIQDKEFVTPGRPQRLWKINHVEHPRRVGRSIRRFDQDRWKDRQRYAFGETGYRHGIPELCVVSAHDRAREYRFWTACARAEQR